MPTPRLGYRTRDGVKVPSVTTILGRFKDSGGLIKWAYKQGREHENLALRGEYQKRLLALRGTNAGAYAEHVDEVAGFMLGGTWKEPLPIAPAHLYDKVEEAALAGTIAHDMIEQHILHGRLFGPGLPDVESAANASDSVLKRAHNSFVQFLKWLANTRITIDRTERGLVSEAHRFGGTLDGLGRDSDGHIVLIDWKTSNAVYGDYLFQLAAYAILVEEVLGEKVTGFHLLRVAKESADFAHHHYGQLDNEKRAFLLMRELYDICIATEKRA